jgi:hypothetical protein
VQSYDGENKFRVKNKSVVVEKEHVNGTFRQRAMSSVKGAHPYRHA